MVNEMLEIKNLCVSVEGKEVLKNVSLSIEKGEVYALMGPNGSGKSTLANTLMGHPKYEITSGKVILDGEDVTEISPDKKAKMGLFLSFQYPMEVDGVTFSSFLKTAYNNVHLENEMSALKFRKLLTEKMKQLKMDPKFASRYLNVGFSGGEKKKAEILQMSILDPKYMMLDETDSGLDVDALRIVSEGVNTLRSQGNAFLIITHYNRILGYVKPDKVFVLVNGELVDQGGSELSDEIEKNGFSKYISEQRSV